jgi:hypothetical protein
MHNQAIHTLGRHLCQVMYKLLKEERDYKTDIPHAPVAFYEYLTS